jgi:hypothetical protein
VDSEAAAAFWSYTHTDNQAEGDRIVRLAHDLQSQYGVLMGGKLSLFLDADKIEWGDDLRAQVDLALAGTTFFIPIITPSYFLSDECRRELIVFVQETQRLKVESLLLPIYYTEVPELYAKSVEPADEAMRLVHPYKYEDWRALCLEDTSSAEYRKGVRRLAERLVRVVRQLTEPPEVTITKGTGEAAPPLEPEADDEEPGLVERLAEGEAALPEWAKVIEAASPEIEQLATLASDATERMLASGGGASVILKITIDLAERLKPHAAEILKLGQENAAILVKVDPAITALLEKIEADPDQALQTEGVPAFLTDMDTLAHSGKQAVEALRGMSQSFDETARLSRALRPPIRDMQRGLRGFVDAQSIYDAWERRVQAIEQAMNPPDDSPAY